ncbi:MAG: glycoside hydrolase family 2 TIM barrel-domain containing protein [Bacteroidota bacterium]
MHAIRCWILALLCLVTSHTWAQESIREVIDFNFDWDFHLQEKANPDLSQVSWESVRLPHDWSIRQGYQQESTSASTGFIPAGVGWYRKRFSLPKSDQGRAIWIEFDGVYCESEVWLNGEKLGFRPSGYSSFAYDLRPHLQFGPKGNELLVKVNHAAYADTRWYSGSGIFRPVRLVKTSATHIAHWGVQITTPQVSEDQATIHFEVEVEGEEAEALEVSILDPSGKEITRATGESRAGGFAVALSIDEPLLWGLETPHLYQAGLTLKGSVEVLDQQSHRFGIRSIRFDANQGFFLNGKSVKLKGVNLHHDAGALGAAVPKAAWRYRVQRLKDIGVNAIRMSHNPHSLELMEVCDEMGLLVMDEFFDEWHRPKGKNLVYIGDNAAKGDITDGYSRYFLNWAERDLKDLIRRDFNHPSVIMWSIGNEIEWTFPVYSQAFRQLNPGLNPHLEAPIFDPEQVKPVFDELSQGQDSLAIIAELLATWVKDLDRTRPITCGSVRPSIAMASGYGEAVDILGFNYRAACYDAAHATYPNLNILGSENWGSYAEWMAVYERDFVAGMFAWTGFAYLGEAGPWPRKGLTLSFFDFAGFKTPRGHFFECLWKEEPKIELFTTPASSSEFSFDPEKGWEFEMQMTPAPVWSELRKWEWYPVEEHWNFAAQEEIIVQAYSNCDEAELFLNGKSQGRVRFESVKEDGIFKWLLPFEQGELMVKGYRQGKLVAQDTLSSAGSLAQITLHASRPILNADRYDLTFVELQLVDEAGQPIRHQEEQITFKYEGPGQLLAVDNGWERNVSPHYQAQVPTHQGRALAIIQADSEKGMGTLTASGGSVQSQALQLKFE